MSDEVRVEGIDVESQEARIEQEKDIIAFETWQRSVDSHMARFTDGMDSNDLPDYDYALAFAQNRNPRTVARQAIRAAGGF